MERKNEITIEGVISGCHYDNRTDVNFPDGYLLFCTDNTSGPNKFFLTGRNKLPMQNGQYVEGKAFSRKFRDDIQTAFIVEELRLFDSKNGRIPTTYTFR